MKIPNGAPIQNDFFLREWDKFVLEVSKQPTLRTVTVEAWKRCRELGINPRELNFTFLTEEELKEKQSENSDMINAARPYMEHLSLTLSDINHVVTLSDKDGWIIELIGSGVDRNAGIEIGACWAEHYTGNNGIGTALATGNPVFIYGIEHYAKVYESWGCLGVPIKSGNGEIIGAIDVSVPTEYAHPDRVTLAMACVASIETSLSGKAQKKNSLTTKDKLSATESLLATVVHDLRNPLTVVKGLGQLGVMNAKSDKEKGYFDQIVNHADGLSELIDDLLNIFTPEDFTLAKISEILGSILEEYTLFCQSRNITISLIQDSDIQIFLKPNLFKRVINNLITNAIEAVQCDGKITISISTTGNDTIIEVKDTGPGIPVDIQKDVFEPFVHRKKTGKGLGLYMVHKTITEVHGGQIWFETEPGTGTSFIIKLPNKTEQITYYHGEVKHGTKKPKHKS